MVVVREPAPGFFRRECLAGALLVFVCKAAGPRLFATLLLVPPLSATVPRDHTVRSPPDASLPFRWIRGSLSSELRLAIRRHLPRVGGIVSHANGT